MSQVIELVRPIGALGLAIEIREEDGEPMDSHKHRIQMNLAIDCTHRLWYERDDYFVGGNMFIFYSLQQVQEVIAELADPSRPRHAFRGPDYFVVKDVDPNPDRRSWKV